MKPTKELQLLFVLVTKASTTFDWNVDLVDRCTHVYDTMSKSGYLLSVDLEKTTQRHIPYDDCIVLEDYE